MKGSDIDARDKDKQTPLHLAAGKVHVDVVGTFLEGGVDITARDIDECTVLYSAVKIF